MGNATSKRINEEGSVQVAEGSVANNIDVASAMVEDSNFVFPDHDILPVGAM